MIGSRSETMNEEWIELGTLNHQIERDLYSIKVAKYRKGGWALCITSLLGVEFRYCCDDESELFDLIKEQLRMRDAEEVEGLFLSSDFLELRNHGRKLFDLRDQRKGRNTAFSNAVNGAARRVLRSSDIPGKEIPPGHVHCPGCEEIFSSKKLLENHKRERHPSLLR